MASNPDFSAVRAAPPWRQKVTSFWRWWTGEIARLVPERFTMLRGGAGIPMVALEGDTVSLVDPRAGTTETRVDLAGMDETRRRSATRQLLERAGETRNRARVALGHGEALVRRVTMPAATEENLTQVLGFEMDRLTPFKAEDVYFDHRVVSRDPASGQLNVQLAVARRELVDQRVAQARALGASVQGVTVRDDVGHAAAPLDLLPTAQRGERESSRERLAYFVLIGAVLALLLIALFYPIYQKRDTYTALAPMLAKAQQDAHATDTIARELEKQVSDYNFLVARKHGTYPVLAFVEEMSRLLPDNTWVQQLDVKTAGKTREVQITGETSSSSKLIELFEQSKLLQNAAPRGTVTRGSLPGTERFMIAAEVRPRAQPEARPVMEMVASIPVPPPPPPPSPPIAVVPNTAVVTPVQPNVVPPAPRAAPGQAPERPVVRNPTPAPPPAPPPQSAIAIQKENEAKGFGPFGK